MTFLTFLLDLWGWLIDVGRVLTPTLAAVVVVPVAGWMLFRIRHPRQAAALTGWLRESNQNRAPVMTCVEPVTCPRCRDNDWRPPERLGEGFWCATCGRHMPTGRQAFRTGRAGSTPRPS